MDSDSIFLEYLHQRNLQKIHDSYRQIKNRPQKLKLCLLIIAVFTYVYRRLRFYSTYFI
jgi:hypothetical protein